MALLRLGYDIGWTAFVTRVPAGLVELIEAELHPTTAGPGRAPQRCRGRLVTTVVPLVVLACVASCAVAIAERAVLLSVAAGTGAIIAIAYRRRLVKTVNPIRSPFVERPTNPHSAGHE